MISSKKNLFYKKDINSTIHQKFQTFTHKPRRNHTLSIMHRLIRKIWIIQKKATNKKKTCFDIYNGKSKETAPGAEPSKISRRSGKTNFGSFLWSKKQSFPICHYWKFILRVFYYTLKSLYSIFPALYSKGVGLKYNLRLSEFAENPQKSHMFYINIQNENIRNSFGYDHVVFFS